MWVARGATRICVPDIFLLWPTSKRRMTPAPADAPAQFKTLFDRHHRAVLGYALRRTSDPHDAADVVAETFLVAWRRLADVPAESDASAWLFGVARRVLANHRRGERRRTDLSARLGAQLAVQLAASPLPEPATCGQLAPALAQLSDDDREILLLSAWEGLAPAEIASALGLSGSTTRSRLRRARQRLERLLDADIHGPGLTPSSEPIQETAR